MRCAKLEKNTDANSVLLSKNIAVNPRAWSKILKNDKKIAKSFILFFFEENQRITVDPLLTGTSTVKRTPRVGPIACTQKLFYFSFRSFRKHRQALERARKKNKELFSCYDFLLEYHIHMLIRFLNCTFMYNLILQFINLILQQNNLF